MIKYFSISALLLLLVIQCNGQNLKKISKLIEKPDYEKAKETLDRAVEKDTSHFGLMYFYSLYYLNKAETHYNLDSARNYIFKAIELRPNATEDQRDDWSKTDINIANIDSAKMLITKLSFSHAKNPLTLSSILLFLNHFPDSPLENKAIYLRDSLAYKNSKDLHTWEGYKHYMETYPQSVYWKDAQTNYEWLLFKEKTRNEKLSEYERFIKDYPKTHHRAEVERFIYQLRTFDHSAVSYEAFIKDYPQSSVAKRAANELYYLQKRQNAINWTQLTDLHPNIDSLTSVAQLEAFPLMTILTEDHFIFLNAFGDTLKALHPQSIDPTYKCGKITGEWLRIKENNVWKVVSRSGIILASNVTKIESLSKELLLIYDTEGGHLYHRAGTRISSSPIQNAKVLNGKFVAIQQADKWGIISYGGLALLDATFDDISTKGIFTIIEQEGRYMVLNDAALNPDTSPTEFSFPFDDFEVIADTLLIGFDMDRESLLDQKLTQLLPLGKHEIHVNNSIWYVKKDSSYQVFDRIKNEAIMPGFTDLSVNSHWLAMKRGTKWTLRALKDTVSSILTPLDSVVLLNQNMAYIERRDSTFLFFQNGKLLPLVNKSSFVILRSIDEKKAGQSFVVYTYKTSKTVLDRNGEKVLEGRYEDIQYLDDSTFIIKSRNKYGIHHSRRGQIVRPIYDQITEKQGLAYLLKGNLIGLLDLSSGVVLPPEFTSRPEKFSDGYLVTKDNKQGVIMDAKTWRIAPKYDEIKQWNDTSFWSKKDNVWSLQSVSGEMIINNVVSLRKWKSAAESDFLLFMKEDKYGVASSTRGLLVPPAYNDIINIGTPEIPIFFAEQHLKTAAFYVVTYFDPNGHVLRSQAYRPHEYDQVYCDD